MAGIAAIGDHGFGRTRIVGLARIQYRPIQRSIGRIAVFDVEVRDQAVLFGREVHLVAILNVARGFRDDVRVGFNSLWICDSVSGWIRRTVA